jgi:hypothetical protein
LFSDLRNNSLLILGSRFDGWLARFFLRIAKGQLGSGTRTADYIADPLVNDDPSLTLFIRRFSRGVQIFQGGDALTFVDELHRRWRIRHPADPPRPPERSQHVSGAVFLSYASEDREIASGIRQALVDAHVDVFFDEDDLQAGHEWEGTLRRNIRECSLFVPVISRHTLTVDRRFFRAEWRLALEEAQQASFSNEESFLLPVVTDDTQAGHEGVPAAFRSVQWERLIDGKVSPNFISRVRDLFRRYQKKPAGYG